MQLQHRPLFDVTRSRSRGPQKRGIIVLYSIIEGLLKERSLLSRREDSIYPPSLVHVRAAAG